MNENRRVRWYCTAVLSIAWLCIATAAFAQSVPIEPGKTSSSVFEPSAGCGCHAALFEQWSTTMHSQALSDPLYQAKLREANNATGGKLGAFCNKCHGPIATLGKEFGGELSDAGKEGISCSFCHQSTGLAGRPANTSHLVSTDGVRRAQLKDPQAPHKAQYSSFHRSAEFCGGCHNVDHPVNGMHLESTYSEWKASSYAKAGIFCQECHMSRDAGVMGPEKGHAAAGGPERDNIYKMTFIGGNAALGPRDLATRRLRAAATMTVTAPEIVAAGSSGQVEVTIANTGAGHYLPTGLTEVREMWLAVKAAAPGGKQFDVGTVRYGTVLKDAKGKYPVELWEAVGIQSDKRIPPNGSVTQKLNFKMPAEVDEVEITASLMYRSAPKELAEKAKVDVPTIEMASASSTIYSSEDSKAAANKPGSSKSWDTMNLMVSLAGLAVVFGVVIGFVRAGRKMK